MESSYKAYILEESDERIREILKTSDNEYEELDEIPSRDRLTYNNGFYVYCTALFVDVRNSSTLPDRYRRPTLARIYRSYISEVVALLNGNQDCREINIHGDSVWGIFNTRYKSDIDDVFSTAAKISSIIDLINCRLQKSGIEPITVGIGLDYGRALMIKAGYKGSGINDVIWMGDVVNHAAKLCGYGNKTSDDYEFMVSSAFQQNLNDDNKKLLTYNHNRGCYHGNVINTYINNWIEEKCVTK